MTHVPLSICAIVPAGGSGARLGSPIPKQYLTLLKEAGREVSVIEKSVETLLACDDIAQVIVVVAPSDIHAEKALQFLLQKYAQRLHLVFEGGLTRRDSVLAGCRYVQTLHGLPASSTWALVHDAARPGLTNDLLSEFIAAIKSDSASVGGLLAIPIADTLKRGIQASLPSLPYVSETVDRSNLWSAQTPQMFRLESLIYALQSFSGATDEASAMEATGVQPRLILGSIDNFKITSAEDLRRMSQHVDQKNSTLSIGTMRIGQGYDSHALVPGRALILGGVEIDFERGLLGHSDADALLHSVTDALLGAAGEGDIGSWFPDTDNKHAGANSADLLREVVLALKAKGWGIQNIDTTIIAQAPKMQPHIASMRNNIARILGCEENCVNVKAKTNERLGHLGRGEAIAAQAVALIYKA